MPDLDRVGREQWLLLCVPQSHLLVGFVGGGGGGLLKVARAPGMGFAPHPARGGYNGSGPSFSLSLSLPLSYCWVLASLNHCESGASPRLTFRLVLTSPSGFYLSAAAACCRGAEERSVTKDVSNSTICLQTLDAPIHNPTLPPPKKRKIPRKKQGHELKSNHAILFKASENDDDDDDDGDGENADHVEFDCVDVGAKAKKGTCGMY